MTLSYFFSFSFALLFGAYRDFPSEGSPSVGLLFGFCLSMCSLCFIFCLSGVDLLLFATDGLRNLFGDHNPSSILICCVIYDLEDSNDAYPQDAMMMMMSFICSNLTLSGEIYFP